MKERLLAAVTILVASVGVGAQNEARVSAITAAQQKIAREFAASDLSPFTAVASRYFSGGDAARVVVRGDAVSFEDVSSADGSADVSFDGRDIWVAPVPGGMTLSLSKKRGDEGVEPGTGTPVNAHTRVGDREVIRLGRYYLETGARPGSGRAIVYDPQASLRKAFNGLHWFPASTALQLPATFAPIERPDAIIVTTSRGLQKEYFRVGVFSFQIEGKVWRLVALALSPAPKPGEELFVPFRDATTGRESYAVGRYLNVAFKGARVPYLLDFNLATNPYCAYSPHYNCVIPPKENTLAAPIRAGEMIYATHAEERSPQAMAAGAGRMGIRDGSPGRDRPGVCGPRRRRPGCDRLSRRIPRDRRQPSRLPRARRVALDRRAGEQRAAPSHQLWPEGPAMADLLPGPVEEQGRRGSPAHGGRQVFRGALDAARRQDAAAHAVGRRQRAPGRSVERMRRRLPR